MKKSNILVALMLLVLVGIFLYNFQQNRNLASRLNELEQTSKYTLQFLMSEDEFRFQVASLLWNKHRDEFCLTPEVVARVASKVYETYNNDLKGKDAPVLKIEDVAHAVAREPGFASLVRNELDGNKENK